MKTHLLTLICLVITFFTAIAQDVGGRTLVSQSRTTIANIGKCDITIKYHSPSVKGRKIFGGIVPYDFVVDGKEFPWRAGSNQRTTIEFSHDVEIEGQNLPAGSYGFVVLVSEKEWTLIFSSGKSWGAFNYDKANDVIRVPVPTQKVTFQEWLSYEFLNPLVESVDVQLKWEETAITFNVKTDALMNGIKSIKEKEEITAADYQALAFKTLEQDPTALDQAMEYITKSGEKLDDYENEQTKAFYAFNHKVLKGELLINNGQKEEGNKLINEALSEAQGFNTYYYALNKLLVKGKKKEALKLLNSQIKRDPENRANYLGLGEYYLHVGDQKKATDNFRQAYEKSKGIVGENYAKYLYHQNRLVLERGND